MRTDRTPRTIVRIIALSALVLGALWVIGIVATGGFAVSIAGRRFSSQEPMRPLYWTTVPLALFVWANGAEQTARVWRSWIARVDHRLAVLLLAGVTFGLGVAYATTTAHASDEYGYVSQADLWLRGDLRLPQPWAADAPWPGAARTFAPLGYRPAATGDQTDIVPAYPPGLPLLMAAAKKIGGHGAVFLIVPLAGSVLVLTTWGIGRRLGSSGAGALAALFVASSPAVLFLLALPLSDVPAAACWALAFYFLLRPGIIAGLCAGIAAGLATLIRPNLIWLSVPLGAWLPWRSMRPGAGLPAERRAEAIARLCGFCAGVIGAALFVAAVNARLYGSPFRFGYGELGPLFGWSNVAVNVRRYVGWLVASQTPLVLVGFAAALWPARRLWPAVQDRSILWTASACVAALWAFYFFYLPFDEWWFLRFLLTSWPFIMLGLASAIVAVSRTGRLALIVCTWIVVLLGIREFNDSRVRGAFDLQRADRIYVAAAQATRDAIPAASVVLSQLHSGSLRYYGGRMTLQYAWLDGAWLDRAVAWLGDHGAPAYALLAREELADFRTHFAGSPLLERLDQPPVFSYPETGLSLYALSAPFAGPTRELTYDARELRSVPPVPREPFSFR